MAVPAYYRSRPHPWHGLPVGVDPPRVVNAFIEITPFDVVKYELEKSSGYLRVDRPQRFSSTPPTLYGFLPRTLCAERVAKMFAKAGPEAAARVAAAQVGEHAFEADGDPLDICVFSERPVNRSEIIVECRVVGGLTMVDGGTADDKILAVLKDDPIWSNVTTIDELPATLVERLVHYFTTYKMRPGHPSSAEVLGTYGPEHAFEVVRAAMEDYDEVVRSVVAH
ncbi:MAG: inorganic pyrophosphatase [Phycisphaerae bacterium]|nr:inorganic pyrophosphatase [Phycisphaerae bacterium]